MTQAQPISVPPGQVGVAGRGSGLLAACFQCTPRTRLRQETRAAPSKRAVGGPGSVCAQC